jgi:hypothetical protein
MVDWVCHLQFEDVDLSVSSRKVFGTSHHTELSDMVKAKMSINALTMQRAQLDDALFNSD